MDGSRLLKSGVYFSRALSWLTGCQRQGRCLTPNPLRKLVSVQTYFHRESDILPILRKQIVHLTLNPEGVYGPKKELKLLEGLGPHIYCIICPMTSFGKLPLGSPNMSKALSSSKNRSNQAFPLRCCVVEMERGMEASSTVPGTGLAPVVAVTMIKPSASLQCHLGLIYSRKKEIIFC